MIEFKIVVKCHYRFNDSDKKYIKDFLMRYFKESKEIQDLYMEEKPA
ncbi:hypothetical protein LCGC14_1899240 [marine sediment metagenome]|uniref:Uncharacterized protein n=1 Tax=marine sediment metagenome TaxID=412755 RepID=A0A0F9GKH3_9ZZZZ